MSIAFEGPGMRDRYLIYGLIDPRTLLIRYIGRSSSGLDRPRSHASKAKNGKTRSARWIRKLQSMGAELQHNCA